jgi:hypothetical protein
VSRFLSPAPHRERSLRFLGIATAVLCASSCTELNTEPYTIERNGVIAEIRNCEAPPQAHRLTCLAFTCEKRLQEAGLLPPSTRVKTWNHEIDDPSRPGWSKHVAVFSIATNSQGAYCEVTESGSLQVGALAAPAVP